MQIYKRTIPVIFGIIFSLIVLELVLRLGGGVFSLIQEYKNRASLSRKDSYRILCLGESTTAGQYPHILQEILNQSNIGVNFSVIDKGAISTNTTMILKKIGPYLQEYHPDLVVTMMGGNDRLVMYYKDLPGYEAGIFRGIRIYRFAWSIYKHIKEKIRQEGIYNQTIERVSLESKDYPINIDTPAADSIGLDLKKDLAYLESVSFYRDEALFLEAEELFGKALARNPKNINIYLLLGHLYLRQKRSPKAEDMFRQSLKLDSKNEYVYHGLGWACFDQHKMSKAEYYMKEARELAPDNDDIHFGLGRFYEFQGKFPEAESCFKKALELNPASYHAYLALSWLYLSQQQFFQAEELLKRAIELHPKSHNVSAALSFLYEKTGRPELAKEYARKLKKVTARCLPATISNYLRLKEILDKRGVRLACVQYPMRSIEPLKDIFRGREGSVIFIDNEKVFKEAVRKDGYHEYFWDMFGGDFGHCTNKGNRLLAENIATILLKEVFGR